MNEIRLCWLSTRKTVGDSEPVEYGAWFLDTKGTRQKLVKLVEAGSEAWGEGTHWIQERELTDVRRSTPRLI